MNTSEQADREQYSRAENEWVRLKGLFGEILDSRSAKELKTSLTGKSIVDVGCGYEPPIGVVSASLDRGIEVKYHGYDITEYSRTILKDLQGEAKKGKLPKEILHQLPLIISKTFLHYGPEYDATKPEFSDIVSSSAGKVGLYLLRHPDVRGEPKTFSTIIQRVFEMSLSQEVPLFITTSNDISRDAIYKFLGKAVFKNGFRLIKNYEIEGDTSRPVVYRFIDEKGVLKYNYRMPPVRDAFIGHYQEYIDNSGRKIIINPYDTSKFQGKPYYFSSTTQGKFGKADDSITILVRI